MNLNLTGLIFIDVDGFDLISNALVTGGSTARHVSNLAPSIRPTSQQLALAATLIVHPQFTIRARKTEDSQASDAAYQFLKSTLETFGTIDGGLADAFVFGSNTGSRRKAHLPRSETKSAAQSTENSEEETYPGLKLESKLAKDDSVFARVENVWQLVGWAFNCAFRYPKRWDRWQLFLDLLFEIWEQDIDDRQQLAEEKPEVLNESMALKCLKRAEGRSGRRTIFRSMFANGKGKSLVEFGEVFKDEIKERKEMEPVGPRRQTLNLDEGKWGDYDVDDHDVNMEDAPEASYSEDEASFVKVRVSELRARLFRIVSASLKWWRYSYTLDDQGSGNP
jgi:hypothetical protein